MDDRLSEVAGWQFGTFIMAVMAAISWVVMWVAITTPQKPCPKVLPCREMDLVSWLNLCKMFIALAIITFFMTFVWPRMFSRLSPVVAGNICHTPINPDAKPCCKPDKTHPMANLMLCAYCRERLLSSCSGLTLVDALDIARYAKDPTYPFAASKIDQVLEKVEERRREWLKTNSDDGNCN